MVRTFPGTASCFSSGEIAGNKMLDIFIIIYCQNIARFYCCCFFSGLQIL